ncbi:hypothetical protein EV360DRAFT_75949 [Lentinula raphanica]|nr:hypothetical protein EV360DRAFT_75949 [Lentinula raphanica]
MDHSQWIQQSLQAMIANNPQLFLQMLQQHQTSTSSSNSSVPNPQFIQQSVASAPNPATFAAAPAPLPSLAAPAPVSLLTASGSAPSAPAPPAPPAPAPAPIPLSAASAPFNPSLPPAVTALLTPTTNSSSVSQSQSIQPVPTYISPVSMLSSVISRAPNSEPARPLSSFMPPPPSASSSSSSSAFPPSITAIQHANRDRLGHANLTLGQSSTATKKKRGSGRKAPRLHATVEAPKVEDAVATANDGTQVVSLVVLVYPPRLTPDECNAFNIPNELHHYLQNRDAFQAVLQALGLYYQFDNLPLNTKVVDLLEALRSSLIQFGWEFPENQETSSFFRRHERLAIQLLRFSGKGNINNRANTPRLNPGKVQSEDMTLHEVVFNTNEYGIAKYVITNTKKFVLHTNTNAYVDEGYGALDEDEIELGCNRDASNEDEDVRVVARMLRDTSETLPVNQNATSNSGSNSPLSLTNTLSEDAGQEEAKNLWESNWVPAYGNEEEVFFVNDRSKIFKKVNDRIRIVTETEPLGFVVKGESPQKMLTIYTALVQRAIDEEDFSALLSQNRHFHLIAIDDHDIETLITSGPGVEKEVMSLFFKEKFDTHIHNYLVQVNDEYSTLSTVPFSSAADLSTAKKNELTVFGATVGLALVHGTYPANINPLLLVYLLNSSNLKSLHKGLVKEYFPELYQTLTRWIALDHSDNDLSYFQPHFATYHNIPVSVLHGRSERHHRSLAWTMLHNAIVGPVKTDHPYFEAFLKGLLLPCQPLGLNLAELASSCLGGIEEFVLSLLQTRITGDYHALRLEYTDKTCTVTHAALRDAYEAVPGWAGFSFEDIFQEFLEGSGLPCPTLMADVQGSFDEVVTLEGTSEKSYRMRMFCWATTGSPNILTDGLPIEVILIDDSDPMYFSVQLHRMTERERLLSLGTISFKTCTRKMQVPASYLLKLLDSSNDSGMEQLYNVKDNIFHWFLVQMLNGIGFYNIL